MKKFVVQVAILLLVIFLGLFYFNPKNPNPPVIPFLPSPTSFSTLQFNGQEIKAEVADTNEKRKQGLGGRSSLGENEGMLFIFEKADKHPFWMKGLSFPLDFVWIKEDKVIDILENILPPTSEQKDADLPIYSSKVEADKVLELNGGSIKRLNIKVGDIIITKS